MLYLAWEVRIDLQFKFSEVNVALTQLFEARSSFFLFHFVTTFCLRVTMFWTRYTCCRWRSQDSSVLFFCPYSFGGASTDWIPSALQLGTCCDVWFNSIMSRSFLRFLHSNIIPQHSSSASSIGLFCDSCGSPLVDSLAGKLRHVVCYSFFDFLVAVWHLTVKLSSH